MIGTIPVPNNSTLLFKKNRRNSEPQVINEIWKTVFYVICNESVAVLNENNLRQHYIQ